MRYVLEVQIAVPRARVLELFEDPDHFADWQPTLVSAERLSGESGQEGTRTALVHKHGRRTIEMVETVTERALPDRIAYTYEAKGVWNAAIHHFREGEGGVTVWEMDTEFRFSGIVWLIAKIMPGVFKKESRSVQERFKAFAEGQADAGSVSEPPDGADGAGEAGEGDGE